MKTMITEDYVSFETAKLLKEKGFNEPTITYFNDWGEVVDGAIAYPRPTQSLVMRWLREVHKFHIFTIPRFEDVEYMPNEWEEQMTGYQYVIIDVSGANRKINQPVEQRAITAESSYESAIKYCLENVN